MLIMIAAVSENNVIGDSLLDKMPWRCGEELQFFKRETMGATLVMGSVTAVQVGKLPGREAIVLSRDPLFTMPGFTTMDMETFLTFATGNDTTFYICGGGEIYNLLMPYIDKAIISYMNFTADGDIFLPPLDKDWETVDEIEFDEFTVITKRPPLW